ncbi:MAG: nucleotidyl transferase AbiEii/AbiGii toxin family protein [Acholeplasmataceae bacterium]|nr:nucleotidyl transferase AbiEii/AbiGii toxin family protein [Acholeplasmataceae bacterium]
MPNYNLNYLEKKAKELGFIRDTLEKVLRLTDILEYFNINPILKENLALKGGTAINLFLFDLPRLSVDIDLDYLSNDSKESMLKHRKMIEDVIHRYMTSEGYTKSPKTKQPHSLDSFVYYYVGASGNSDNIKIEINYSLRSHIFETEERTVITKLITNALSVKTLSKFEIFGSKINALLTRAAARDLYDVINMIQFGLFSESEKIMLKKCVIFYQAITTKEIDISFDTLAIDSITQRKIKTDLLPVIHQMDDFELEKAKETVKAFIRDLMILTTDEQAFLKQFDQGEYHPELLFDDPIKLERIKNHPMALWKTRTIE